MGIWDERDLVTSCCARAWYCGYFFHHGGKEINEGERRLRSRTDRSTVQPDEAGMQKHHEQDRRVGNGQYRAQVP